MLRHMWIVLAIGASITWGIVYVLGEQIYRRISVITSLGIATLATGVVMIGIALLQNSLKYDMGTIARSRELTILVVAETIALMVAELLIGFSIAGKNATLAGLVEVSYPIFAALFAYIFFKETQLDTPTIIGGILIFSGVVTIYMFSK